MNIPGIKDAGRIDDSFYRGAQPSKKGLKELRRLGVNTIIDLRGEWPWEVKKERKEAESLGMSFINFPGNGWTRPSDREVAEFFRIIQERPRRRIFVHCWLGGDRSGVFIALYRIAFDGWTSEAAIREMRAYHFKAFFHPNMTSYVRGFPERLARSPELAPFRHMNAAQMSVREGVRVNMTLCFSQEQAAAVYAATKGSKAPVYVSPFVGRLDDRGENGMDLVKNIKQMYEAGDGHVHVLPASIRHLNHLLGALALKAELVTAPGKVWEEWADASFPVPGADFVYQGTDKANKPLKAIVYKSIDLNREWESFDISHELTTKGIQQFVADYKSTLKQSA